MLTLAQSFTRQGFAYRQLERAGNLAIYSQSRHGRIQGYEVIRARHRPEREINGKRLDAGERYPISEEWGAHAFTCLTMESAKARLARMA